MDDSQAIRAAENLGFTDCAILDSKILAVGMRGCSQLDAALYELKAKNPGGKTVRINVCVGWPFKSATVRVP